MSQMTRRFGPFTALAASAFALACGGGKPARTLPDGPALQKSSSGKSREKISITVYNSNFGLVRERRQVDLGKGKVELAFADVSAHIQPETVHITSLTRPDALVYGVSLYAIGRGSLWQARAALLKGTVMAAFGAGVLAEVIGKLVGHAVPAAPGAPVSPARESGVSPGRGRAPSRSAT